MVKIRLRRMGSTHKPFYRVVVSDSRRTPTSSAIEELGYYDPRNEPAIVRIDRERVDHWVSNGARMSSSVKKLLDHANTDEAPQAEKTKAEEPATPKAEAKTEEPKAEEPKAEEAAAEEPEAEEAKAEEAKAEEAEAEETKAEGAEAATA